MAENANREAGYALEEGQQALRAGELQSKVIQDNASFEGKRLKTSQSQFNASQRAIMAAAGVTGVTAEDITTSTLSQQQLDEMALRYNADVKSWEVKTGAAYKNQSKQYEAWQSNIQADQFRYAGKAAKYAGKVGAFSTILSTVASVATTAAMGAGGGGTAGAGNAGSSNSFLLKTSPYYPR